MAARLKSGDFSRVANWIFLYKDAKFRLKDADRAITHPISTINDLLTIHKPANIKKLLLDHTSEEIIKVENALKQVLKPNIDEHFVQLLTKAIQRLR